MSRPKNQLTDTEPLESWEYELIISQLPDHWKMFYELLWQTGVRVGEALAILKTDVVDNGVWIISEKRKDKLRVHIPLSPGLYNRLVAHIHYKRGSKVFPFSPSGAWLALKEACKKGNVRTTIHPHSFRHGFGYRAMKADLGASSALDHLRTVQRMMRHTSIRSTEIYTTVTKNDVIDAYKKINKGE
jgi:integrase